MIRRPPRSTLFPTRRSSDLVGFLCAHDGRGGCFAFVDWWADENELHHLMYTAVADRPGDRRQPRSEEHTSELQSLAYLVCRLLLEKKKNNKLQTTPRRTAGT